MSEKGADSEGSGTREFFAREYYPEDLRWTVARLLGYYDPRTESGTPRAGRAGRVTA
ncbi:MAG: hypothetical protein WCB18_01885 [Thermoplasmata archaeon]